MSAQSETAVIGITGGIGTGPDACVLSLGWQVSRATAEELISELTGRFGPPMEAMSTLAHAQQMASGALVVEPRDDSEAEQDG